MSNLNDLENKFIDKPQKSNTDTGLLRFFIGLVLFAGGIFYLFQIVEVRMNWFTWSIAGMGIPSGVILIPLLIGVAMLFFNHKSIIPWLIFIISLILVVVTVVLSVRIYFPRTSLLMYFFVFGSIFAGIGLLLSTLFKKNK